ncbi:hypothetical protein PHMEG_00017245 [Phytophthora megakarya]|uniref:SWIM-type domain-containing protein n=1 Tax=Phytophthora megakarya TaxID=4795 RepID=A0A225VX23_9STRA|nr:hypothetical protein PHMEG_00017245 [Phytophthora megakarya]
MKGASCRKSTDKIGTWDVLVDGRMYSCNDIEWSCTCAFATSTGIPCQHIMYVFRYGHGFEELPP